MKSELTRFAQAAGFMLVLTFTFSCSDEKDETLFSYGCKTPGFTIKGKTGDLCEGGEGIPSELLANVNVSELKNECEEGGKSKYYDSCPTDYVKKCKSETNEYKIYCLYGDEFKNVTCEEFFDNW